MRTTWEINPLKSIIGKRLVPVEKILLPPLHVKLGMIRSFVIKLRPEVRKMLHETIFNQRITKDKVNAGTQNRSYHTSVLFCAMSV